MTTLLTGCSIIDAAGAEPRADSFVLMDGDTIRQAGQGRPPTADRTIDLGGAFLLPGLWDVHTHLTSGTWTGYPSGETSVERALTAGRNAMDALRVGVTSLRVVGIEGWADVAWRDAFNSGRFLGPRLFCCGRSLSPTAGHGATLLNMPKAGLDGPTAMIREVRLNIKHGVDQIKLITTGGIMGTGHDVMDVVMFTREEMDAAIRIATQRGLRVATHATSPQAIKWAVEAGTSSIEHAYVLDEEAAAMMAERGVYLVPTVALSHLTSDQADSPFERAYSQQNPLPHQFRERANAFAGGHEESLGIALDAGIKIASGSDQGPPRDAALLEIELLARTGLGAHGAIVAATSHAAEICGVGDRLGTIQAGKLADMVALEANPLDDIHNIRRLRMVLKGGQTVVDNR